MKDIKVMDSIREFVESRLDEKPFHPVAFFAQSLGVVWNKEEDTGITIGDIASCFKAQFNENELRILISELSKPK